VPTFKQKTLAKYQTESVRASFDNHSVQVNLDDCMGEKDSRFFLATKDLISPEDIYREKEQVPGPMGLGKADHPDEQYGMEKNPHVTLLYGLSNEADYFAARQKLSQLEPPVFKLGNVGSFRNDDSPYDVVILHIDSDGFHEINGLLQKFPNVNSFPKYNPHMTLGYVKKGACRHLDGKRLDIAGAGFTAGKAVWSHKDGYMLDLPFKG
jgi:hypothetical protein